MFNMLVYFIKCVWVFARLSASMTKINTFGNLFFVPESEGMPLVDCTRKCFPKTLIMVFESQMVHYIL